MGSSIARPDSTAPSAETGQGVNEGESAEDFDERDDSFGDFTASPPESGMTLTAIGRLKVRSTVAPASAVTPILAAAPEESAPRSRSVADALAAANLPPPTAVPVLTRSASSLVELPLDPRAAFLASQIDGSMSLQCLLDLGVMPRIVMLEALTQLIALGVVVFG